ncbi:hypothetical protein Chor_007249 [Crotalus horridus]
MYLKAFWVTKSYTLITPGVLRTDTEEKILVEAHGDNAPKQLDISVHDFPRKQKILYQTKVDMNPAGGMLVTPTIKERSETSLGEIPAEELDKDFRKNQYVVVQVTAPGVNLEKVVLLSYQSGFVFIQTDKGIYTPGSPVRYRVFSMDHNMHRMDKTVIVEFQTPQNIVVSSNPVNPNLIRPYNLPELVSFGTWKAVAKFAHSPEESYTAYFDVREYVLPSFEVRLQPSEKFLYIDGNTDFHVSITARYLYGKTVEGVAFVLFGVKIDSDKQNIPDSLTRIPSKVCVTNPDGSPAVDVPVVSESIHSEGTTLSDGTAKLILNTPLNTQSLSITVKTNHVELPEKRQAKKSMTATAYQTQGGSGNYLHIAITSTEIKPGNNLPISFSVRGNANSLNQIQYFTYLILTKGKIFKVGRQPRGAGQNLVTMTLPITPDLIPSFRFVAYYQMGNSEIVADSVWVDVKDTCMGTLVVKGASSRDNRIQKPGAAMKIKLEGDPGARVGLVAVDKAVYVLNDKYKISQTKMQSALSLQIGGVAALLCCLTARQAKRDQSTCEFRGQNLVVEDIFCMQVLNCKPSDSIQSTEALEAAQFPDQALRKCCEDGMHENPMGYSCEKREKYIQEGDACKAAFLECCRYIKGIHDENKREDELFLARSDFEDEFFGEDNIISRISSKTVSFYLRDSITTWEVLAVSITPTKGICVAEPYEITVMKDFFIDLRLPYSVVKNEQVEVRAILYNYVDDDIDVRVELLHNPAFCSVATETQRYRTQVTIKALSSWAVSFVIVPLQQGLHDIEVRASVRGQLAADGVKKKLKVVPEGIRKDIVTVIELDPHAKGIGGTQEQLVKANKLDDRAPETETETKITVQGDHVAQLIENSIDGSKLNHLIITPYGCGEQNMMHMTAPVIATYYLDTTGQWETLGVDRRAEAVQQIKKGYAQQLVYKKADHSYSAFPKRDSSSWLTAYVVKVFALAAKIVKDINPDIICGGVRWLILNRQQPDGVFKENAPVLSGTMQGGLQGAEPEVSLTAFILVALLESRTICNEYINSLDSSINKAADYLLKKYEKLQRPYTTALTAYALASAGLLKDDRGVARYCTTGVVSAVSVAPHGPCCHLCYSGFSLSAPEGNRWEEYNAHTHNIEGTSYALLALLKMKKFDQTGSVVRWLTDQKYYGGTYGQTQATVVGFQALAEYEIAMPSHKDLNLDIVIKLPEREVPISYRIDATNALRAQTTELKVMLTLIAFQTKLNEDFTVSASGDGKATMTILTVYNAQVQEEENVCNKFHLEVSVENVHLNSKQAKGAKGALKLKICTRYLGEVDSTMTIIDVSMLTGFLPDAEDLTRLSKGVDRYISKFEIDNKMAQKGAVIIYLDKNDVTLRLRIQQACGPNVDYVYKAKLLRIEEKDASDIYVMDVLEVVKRGTDRNPQAKPRQYVSQRKCQEALNLKVNNDYLIWGLRSDLWHKKDEYVFH